MIYDHVQATGAYDAARGLSDLFNVCLQNDDVQDFDTRWEHFFKEQVSYFTRNVLEG